MRVQRFVTLRGAVDAAQIRTAVYRDVEHMLVPLVMMVGDIVVHPLNAPGPEFVPAEELARVPGGWNGRPVLPDHPSGGRATANEPDRDCFGREIESRMHRAQRASDVFRVDDRRDIAL